MSEDNEEKTLVWRLREAARLCSNAPYAAALRGAAEKVQRALDHLYSVENCEAMRTLNGVWGNAERILKNTPPEGTPDPTSGDVTPARLAA